MLGVLQLLNRQRDGGPLALALALALTLALTLALALALAQTLAQTLALTPTPTLTLALPLPLPLTPNPAPHQVALPSSPRPTREWRPRSPPSQAPIDCYS